MNSTAQDEITAYVTAVRAALADLPEATREELLEDLPEHLAEIRAEDTVTLTDRLGTPEAYASELRAAAGFVGGFPDPPTSSRVTLGEIRTRALRVLEVADVKVGPVIGYTRASEFLVLLRPAWWVLRGYLAAMALAYLLDENSGSLGLLPRIGGSELIALALLAACVVGSILLGRRGLRLGPWPRYALYSGTTFLVIFALAGLATVSVRQPGYQDVSNYESNPYSSINDVFVYDADGKLVRDARLFDQNGEPIQLGGGWCSDPNTGESWHTRNLGYPYCPEYAPFGSPSPSVGATPDPASTAEEPADPPAPSVAPPASSASPSAGVRPTARVPEPTDGGR